MYNQIKRRKLQDASVFKEAQKAITEKLKPLKLTNCQLRVHSRLSGTHYMKHLKKVWDKEAQKRSQEGNSLVE